MSVTTRYEAMFSQLEARNEGAFIPFVTLGDPDLAQSEAIIKTLIDHGADAIELGFPFSDPVADGPTIQRASIRALASQTTVEKCFALLERIRQYNSDIPIGLLVYGNLVMAHGRNRFYQRCAQAGVDSVLVADVPIREGAVFKQAANEAGVAQVFIAPPDASTASLQNIARHSQGYIYLLSRAGVTGANQQLKAPAAKLIAYLKAHQGAPAVLGFGISTPEHVKTAVKAGAAGAISGSAVVQRIEDNLADPAAMLDSLGQFVSEMKAATKPDA
ncbi:MAG: tryptophan synthase subunit alpha [Idiomarina sp.]|nr:tryptophan synthase subunit alpha [Idiomarina sp.]